MRHTPFWIARLALAADAFVFSRPLASVPDGQSVIAGYPWFGDWGRDTMISLPGLTLATGRPEIARRILETFAGFVSEGMLPNLFPGAGDRPSTTPQMPRCGFSKPGAPMSRRPGIIAALREAFPVLVRHDRMAPAREPATASEWTRRMACSRPALPGVQLTWMDAKVGDWVVTPRIGKPVEINALWYNALAHHERVRRTAGEAGQLSARRRKPQSRLRTIRAPRRRGFVRRDRWPGWRRCQHQAQPDLCCQPAAQSARPPTLRRASCGHAGAIFSLPTGCARWRPAAPPTIRAMAAMCGSATAAITRGRSGAGYSDRSASPTIASPAMRCAAEAMLAPMRDALKDQAMGTIGEIFDGDPPHHPRGAPAQAWSVACTLDAWRLLTEAERRRTRKSGKSEPTTRRTDKMPQAIDAERRRIEESRNGAENWRRWGPYLSERQWGTVREDYSPGGTAWDYLTHDQARSRAYRWGEDGIAGFCDDRQLLCLSLALWNGRDPILKERLFGLTNEEGNHGEDVKELYYYLDAIPSYAYARMLYKLPQAAYPYQRLIEENARRRGSPAMEFELIDTGHFR